MTGPYYARTEYLLNSPTHKVIDERYPNAIGSAKTYESAEAAEAEAERLNVIAAAREAGLVTLIVC